MQRRYGSLAAGSRLRTAARVPWGCAGAVDGWLLDPSTRHVIARAAYAHIYRPRRPARAIQYIMRAAARRGPSLSVARRAIIS